ncbi:MAG: chromophore lyase CpcT/CpeT [candidate division Zixibacteria bacterium]|nr:chromophore lyase CpcT/CpeT [candidate division Zixibacteria bacterium]
MRKLGIPLLLVTIICLFACAKKEGNYQRLLRYMTGSFSSQQQAEADSGYFDIRLEMTPIWRERSDAFWLYVEQATATSLDRPYRQRVYQLVQINDSTFESIVYTFDDPLRFAGAWKDIIPLAGLTPDSLVEREGCSIILMPKGDTAFVGSTVGKNCTSDLNGAAYARSEVIITETGMISWDRGFDSVDNQVWGTVEGGYIFKKISPPKK